MRNSAIHDFKLFFDLKNPVVNLLDLFILIKYVTK